MIQIFSLISGIFLVILLFSSSNMVWAEENLPWELEFQGSAERDGICIIRIMILPPYTGNWFSGTPITATFKVTAGMDEYEKAAAAAAAVQAADPLGRLSVEYDSDDNEFFARPSDSKRYIKDATITCTNISESGSDAWKDQVETDFTPLRTGFFNLVGEGKESDGIARLSLGDELPIIEISTFGKSGNMIIEELVTEFNIVYSKFDYTATMIETTPGLYIDQVPCPLGINGGVVDSGLFFSLGLLESSKSIDSISYFFPPYVQTRHDISPDEVICNPGFQKLKKTGQEIPICMTPSSTERLIERGWAEYFEQ